MDLSKINGYGSLDYDKTFDLIGITHRELVEKDEYRLRWLRDHLVTPIRTVVDIGGNLGMTAIFARELFPDARIVSIEACSDTFNILRENASGFNVELHNFALGDGRRLYLQQCPVHCGANQMIGVPTKDMVGVASYSLPAIFSMLKIEAPYVIKVDIEGGEAFLYGHLESSKILSQSAHSAMEYHRGAANFVVSKCEFDKWILDTHKGHLVTGITTSGDCNAVRGAVYTMTDRKMVKL